MGSIDDKRIKRAVKKLEKESKKTSEDLIYKPLKDLNHRDVEKRKDAVKSILVGVTLFPDPERKREVLEGLLGALEDKDTEVRGIAVEALQVMAVWHQQNTTETAPSNPEATSLQNSQGGGCPEGYMEAMRPIDETNRCSDQECPCPPPGTVIPRGKGYIYISQEVVDFRRDCPTMKQATEKIKRMENSMGASIVISGPGVVVPILMCKQGAKKRGLDLKVAQEDARSWWETGLVPLRATPMAR